MSDSAGNLPNTVYALGAIYAPAPTYSCSLAVQFQLLRN